MDLFLSAMLGDADGGGYIHQVAGVGSCVLRESLSRHAVDMSISLSFPARVSRNVKGTFKAAPERLAITIAHRTTTNFPLASFDSMTRCASWISSKRNTRDGFAL